MDDRSSPSGVATRVGPLARVLVALFAGLVIVAAIVLVVTRIAHSTSTSATSVSTGACVDDLGGPGALIGFDARDGAQRWARRIGARAVAAQVDGTVAVIGLHGDVVALDASTGDVRWCRDVATVTTSTSTGPPSTDAVSTDSTSSRSARVPVENLSVGQPSLVAGPHVLARLSADGHVVGLDPASGDVR